MKINKSIVATDNNKLYFDCLPLIAEGWGKMGNIETVVAAIGKFELNEKDATILNFDEIEGIPTGFIAQVIRFILPAFFPEEICITSDIDMLPLSKNYFVKEIEKYPSDSILILTSDAYGVDNKFPMCYIVAKGKYFKLLIGLNDVRKETINNFIIELYNKNLGWVTDEVFFGACIKEKKKDFDIHFLERCKHKPFNTTRIDRSNWNISKIKLLRNKYIDSHLLRPISNYRQQLELLELYVDNNNNGFKAIFDYLFNKLLKVFK